MLDFARGFDNDLDVALIAGNYKCTTPRTKYSAPETRTGPKLLKNVDATAVSVASFLTMLSRGSRPAQSPSQSLSSTYQGNRQGRSAASWIEHPL